MRSQCVSVNGLDYFATFLEDKTIFFRIKAMRRLSKHIGVDNAIEVMRAYHENRWQREFAELLKQHPTKGSPLQDALELFYYRYLGLKPIDVRIVKKTEHELVVRCYNDCPILNACIYLGLDTREVCGRVFHSPCQKLLSMIDPRLEYIRLYHRIRPYTGFCEEKIVMRKTF